MVDKPDELADSKQSLFEHLAELRKRIIYSVLAFVIAMSACFYISRPIFNFMARPICDALNDQGRACELIFTGPQTGFVVALSISMFGGFILAFPVIAFQLWRFVAPGLYKQEKNAVLPFLLASPALFFIGAAFAYYVVLPMAFNFFLGYQQFGPEGEAIAQDGPSAIGISFLGTIDQYLGLTMKFVIAFGLCFQLPVLLTLMGKAGLVSSEALARTRRYAIVGIMIFAAVATPPDVVSQLILFAVIYPLYELSIQLVKMVEKKREAQLKAEGYYDNEASPEQAK